MNIIYTIIYQMAINNRKMNKLLLCKMTQTSPVELTCVITLKISCKRYLRSLKFNLSVDTLITDFI